MAEKKKPESKVEPVEKKNIGGKIYNFFDYFFGEGYNKRQQKYRCKPDLSDLSKSEASLFGTTEYLSPRDAVQLMYSNDPEVRKLQRKNVLTRLRTLFKEPDYGNWGAAMRKALQDGTDKPLDEVCREGVPEFIYEPNVRYKRIENPDYKRSRNYSVAGTVTGIGMLATGLASGILPLAYAGAALAISSFGYQSGQWVKNRKEDQSFEKLPPSLSELEKKAKKHAGSMSDIAAKKSYKDDALYVRRLYCAVTPTPYADFSQNFHYTSMDTRKHPLLSGWGIVGASLTALAGFCALYPGSLISFTTAGTLGLATLSHYVGSFFGKENAVYQKVGNLEEKVNTAQDRDGSETPAQPKYKTLSKYEKELKK